MLRLSILFLLLSATINSLVDSAQSNYYNKIVIEYNGHKYINPYAFSDMNFTLETLDEKDFYFKVRKPDADVIPIKMNLSTATSSKQVLCDGSDIGLVCIASTGASITDLPDMKDQKVALSVGYKRGGLNFETDNSKYLLKISSAFTPAYLTTLCSFLMEWPSSVNPKDPEENVPNAPSNYDVCEESCDSLNNETGVKFGSKGTVQFTMALLNKSKEYKLLHSFGYFSPIYTIVGSDSCTKFTTNIKFNDGSLTFKRDGEKMDIETDFKPLTESLKDVPVSNASNVNFYFYKYSVYCTFFDPQNAFQLRLLKLPQEIAESMKSETNLKIGHTSSVNECNETLKLLVGNGVRLLFPKSVAPNSTAEPTNTTLPANETEIAKTSKPKDKTEEASFPLWAIILISSIAGILLIFGLSLGIYCLIKKRKNKCPKKNEISELERRMLAKKPKKNQNDEINTNNEIGLKKKAPKEAAKKGEKKRRNKKKTTKEVSLMYETAAEAIAPPPELPSAKERTASARQKLEKIFKRIDEQNKEENGQEVQQENVKDNGQENVQEYVEEDGRETTEDGQPPLTAIAKSKTKSVSKTQTEAVEIGVTQKTQNSIQPSKSITPEDVKLPGKHMVLKSKSKTKTADGTAPTQFSGNAE